jgi:putative redox protein
MVRIDWQQGLRFEAATPSGHKLILDSGDPGMGGLNQGPTPLEVFLVATAACGAMDVISILKKKRQEVTAYRVEIEGERTPPGEFPRPYTSLRIRHVVSGAVDPEALRRAVELSDTKYCSVLATLRFGPEIVSEGVVE